MIRAAQSEPGIAIAPEVLDADPKLLNCQNGTLNLLTGELQPHNPKDLITKICAVNYNPQAHSDLWEHFLHHAMKENSELISFLQRAVGYTLIGQNREEVMFFVHGPGATGKSTFLGAIQSALGDYAKTTDFEPFLAKPYGHGVRDDLARLPGARLVVSQEVQEGRHLAENVVKALTGRDVIAARPLYGKYIEFRPSFVPWMVANDAPKIRADDDAMWRRIIRIPFEEIIPEGERDPMVKEVLCDPVLSGEAVLAWAVEGYKKYREIGLKPPESVKKATQDLRNEMDPLAKFIEECCELKPDAWIPASELWRAYEMYCQEDQETPVRGKLYGKALRRRGCTSELFRDGKKVKKGWHGIQLKEEIRKALLASNYDDDKETEAKENGDNDDSEGKPKEFDGIL